MSIPRIVEPKKRLSPPTHTSYAYYQGKGFDVAKIETLVQALEPNQKVASLATVLNGYRAFADPFEDNVTGAKWNKHEVAPATVAEANQRVECTMGAPVADAWRSCGYVSADAYDIDGHWVEIDITNFDDASRAYLVLCLTKTLNSFWYTSENNWWELNKVLGGLNDWGIQRRKDGAYDVSDSGAFAGATGKLRIMVWEDVIYCWENGNLRYAGTYGLSSTTVYIYFGFYTYYKVESGTDHCDDFLSTLEW